MRLFTKLRAEQISTVAYPLPVGPVDPAYPAETRSSSAVAQAGPRDDGVYPQPGREPNVGQTEGGVYPQTVRAPDGSAKIFHNQAERDAANGTLGNQPSSATRTNTYVDRDGRTGQGNQPDGKEVERVVITTIHRESYESPKSELLLSPRIADRKDPEGPIVGDWYVTDYDIMTDKVIRKVYDNDTFTQYFKASIGG